MRNLIESITQKDFVRATEIFEESIKPIVEKKLFEKKKMYAAKLSLTEKVRAKGITPETIEAAREHSKKTAEENPTDPAAFFGRIKANKTPDYNVKKLKEEKVHDDSGEHIGDLREISRSHAKDSTKTVKKYHASRKSDDKTFITADNSIYKES